MITKGSPQRVPEDRLYPPPQTAPNTSDCRHTGEEGLLQKQFRLQEFGANVVIINLGLTLISN